MTPNSVVSDALDALREGAEGDPALARHRSRCLVRTSGSWVDGITSEEEAERLLRTLAWHEASPDADARVEGARYYRAHLPRPGMTRVVTVAEALRLGLQLEVRVHKPSTSASAEARAADPNPWGLGIFAVGSSGGVPPVQTRDVWVVLGPGGPGGGLIPWCWHPGAPAPPVQTHHYGALADVVGVPWEDQSSEWQRLARKGHPVMRVAVHLPHPREGE